MQSLLALLYPAAVFALASLAARAFFKFATSFAFAAGESFRFGLMGAATAFAGWESRWNFAHLAFCASAIRFLAAADIFLPNCAKLRRFDP
jgi:hypothetical protein